MNCHICGVYLTSRTRGVSHYGLAIYIKKYLTLRSVLSLNNRQNSEMKICENMKLTHVENHHNYHKLHSE
jgi:hypothetical protein